MIQKPPGIEDIFPDRINKWNFIINSAKKILNIHNYKEIIIPIMEFTEVFSRGLGDETDIVSKEMFSFEDRGGRSLTLRPEGTASMVRAYVENGDFNRLALSKFFYFGPMFRAERPQKGRLRQFNQFGAELFGSDDPFYDFEIISMVDSILKEIGLKEYTLLINSIGCSKCRTEYINILKQFYNQKIDEICDDCKNRLGKNTLRLLDCKKESCKKIRKDAPIITDYLDDECSSHHKLLKSYLDKNNIEYLEDPYLVRGLDYYNKTTFEFVTNKLGGQNAIAAGGRYDSLVEHFEGKPTPAVGFAAGIERIFLILDNDENIPENGIDAFIIHSGDTTKDMGIEIVNLIRENGFSADIDPGGKGFKSQFKKADREKAKYAIIIGEDELKENKLTVKNLKEGIQETIERDGLISFLSKNT